MTTSASGRLTRIARFPVKGLSPQPLEAAELSKDQPIPGDRRFALAHGASAFDPANPRWEKKAHFLNWARNPQVAALHCVFDVTGTKITVADLDPETSLGQIDNADLTTQEGRAALETLVLERMDERDTRGKVSVVEAPNAWFSDVPDPFISIQNVASLQDLGRRSGKGDMLDWRRLRANLLVEGFPALAERDWVGKRLRIGTAMLQVEEAIGRCVATHINPDTAERDLPVLDILQNSYGNTDCGIYARVVEPGLIRLGQSVELLK
jgi:uncharacterized protein